MIESMIGSVMKGLEQRKIAPRFGKPIYQIPKSVTIEMIESIIFSDHRGVSKRLKHIPNPHPMANAQNLLTIRGEYFQWEVVQ